MMERYRDRSFIFVTETDRLSSLLQQQPNASHYSLHRGWIVVRHKTGAPRQVLSVADAAFGDLLGGLGLPTGALPRLWEKLPNLGRQCPTLKTTGPVELRDVQVFSGGEHAGWKEERAIPAGEIGVVWLSGRYVGTGRVRFDLEMGNRLDLFSRSSQRPQTLRLSGQTTLKQQGAGERWVGALHARQLAETMGGEMQLLRTPPSGRRQMVSTDQATRAARLAELRREIVRLSRAFGFISSETAFIALPPELQRKYGLTPEKTAAQQSYNPNAPSIVPEPSVLQLTLISIVILTGAVLWRRRRAN
jgi:hypothetical protein